jgi:predicted trehalose synthase
LAKNGRRRADEALLVTLACGATVESAASKLGMGVRTIHRRLADPTFKKRLQDIRSDMVQRATGMLTASAMEAVKTLLDLQKASTPAAVRLGAARTILEIGIKLRETAELEERIAALEAQLAAPPPAVPPPAAPPPEAPPPAAPPTPPQSDVPALAA